MIYLSVGGGADLDHTWIRPWLMFIDIEIFMFEFGIFAGPNETTLGDYWRMIWQENISVMVMLCNLREEGRVREFM